MFGRCSNLKNITVHFLNWNEEENSTLRWLSDVYIPDGTETDENIPVFNCYK